MFWRWGRGTLHNRTYLRLLVWALKRGYDAKLYLLCILPQLKQKKLQAICGGTRLRVAEVKKHFGLV